MDALLPASVAAHSFYHRDVGLDGGILEGLPPTPQPPPPPPSDGLGRGGLSSRKNGEGRLWEGVECREGF